jgi:hypothetical protein
MVEKWKGEKMRTTNKTRTARSTIIIGIFLLHAFTAAGWAGELVAWGNDSCRQVSNTPSGYDFASVAAGGNHNVAVKSDGSLISWGYDYSGQVSNTPAGNNFVAVAAGMNHSVALKSDGSLIAWGSDSQGQVSNTPSGNNFVAVVAGNSHNVALKSDGSLVSWGYDFFGQVSNTPTGRNFVAITAGYDYSVALKSDGSLVAWGKDSYGLVSNPPAGNNFIAVAAGGWHSVALKSDGSLVAWGSDTVGQVSKKPAGSNFIAITAGEAHSVALKSDGSLVAWGWDPYGQVSDTPTGNDFIAISALTYHNVAIRNTQTIPTYTLTTNVSPSGSGSVIKYPDKSSYSENESVQLTATANSGYTFSNWNGNASGSTNPITIIMNSNKSVTANFTAITKPNVSITATDSSAGEPDNDGSFTVSRTGDTSANLLVYYSTTGSTASAGTDYTALPGYVYILAGQSSASIPVNVIDDTTVESSETVRLTISSNSAYNIGSPSYATVTITDDDNAPPPPPGNTPVVTINATDASASEPANDGAFTVSRTGDTSGSLRVYYSTSGSTASSGTDYVAIPFYVDIPAGQSSAVISVAVINDYTAENSETVQLTILNISTYTIGSPSSATVTIADDDTAPQETPVVTITAPDASAGEPSNNGYFTVSRTGATSSSLRVYYSTSGSTASSGADYAALPGYVDIPAGQYSASISVAVIDDGIVESSETVRLTISSNAAYAIGSPSYATVTITDNDSQQPEQPVVTITAPDASAAEPANDGYFRISRTGDTSSNLLVYYSTSGTATAGTDYAALSNYVYIPAGQSSVDIPVVVYDDTTVESSETVRLTISSNAAYAVGSPSYATVTITDNDNVPPASNNAEKMMTDTLDFFYLSVDQGYLEGVGKNKGFKDKALNGFQTMLETALQLIQSGNYDGACGQLSEALSRCDGGDDDYVTGDATSELANMIRDVITELGC